MGFDLKTLYLFITKGKLLNKIKPKMILRNHIIFKLPSINLVNKTGTSLVITILNSQTKKKKKKKQNYIIVPYPYCK